jgi:hypothetical protein
MFEIPFFRRGEELRTEIAMVLEAHDDRDSFLSSEDHDASYVFRRVQLLFAEMYVQEAKQASR